MQQRHEHRLHIERKAQHSKRLWQVATCLQVNMSHIQSIWHLSSDLPEILTEVRRLPIKILTMLHHFLSVVFRAYSADIDAMESVCCADHKSDIFYITQSYGDTQDMWPC